MQSRTRLVLVRGYGNRTYVQEEKVRRGAETAEENECDAVRAMALRTCGEPGWKEWYGEVTLPLTERPRRLAFDGILTENARVCMRLVLKLPRAVAMALSAGAVTMRSQPQSNADPADCTDSALVERAQLELACRTVASPAVASLARGIAG